MSVGVGAVVWADMPSKFGAEFREQLAVEVVGFDDAPSAYLNLLRPRKSYPLDPGKPNGGLELLSHLMPQRS